MAFHQVGDSRDKMKLLVFFVLSIFLTVSWAQQPPTPYKLGPPKPPGAPEDNFDPAKNPNFSPRGHMKHRGYNNGPQDNIQPAKFGTNPSPENPDAGPTDGAPPFGSPRSSIMQPKSAGF